MTDFRDIDLSETDFIEAGATTLNVQSVDDVTPQGDELEKIGKFILDNKDNLEDPKVKEAIRIFKGLEDQGGDYSFMKEAGKRLSYGLQSPFLNAYAGMSQQAAQSAEMGIYPLRASGMGPGIPMGQMYMGDKMKDAVGSGKAYDEAQVVRDFVNSYRSEIMKMDPDFEKNHPNLTLALEGVPQMMGNLITFGVTTPYQLTNEYITQAEQDLGKGFNEFTQEERQSVAGGLLVYTSVGTGLEYVGMALGPLGKPLSRLASGKLVNKKGLQEALERGLEAISAGNVEGITEFSQGTLSEILRIVSGISDKEITLQEVFDSEAWTNYKAGLFSGGGSSVMVQAGESIYNKATGKEYISETDKIAAETDTTYVIQYTDLDGNPQFQEVTAPSGAVGFNIMRDVLKDRILEGSKVHVLTKEDFDLRVKAKKESQNDVKNESESNMPTDPDPITLEGETKSQATADDAAVESNLKPGTVENQGIPLLGQNRPASVDTTLAALTDEELEAYGSEAINKLTRIEREYDEHTAEEDTPEFLNSMAQAQDRYVEYDIENFRRQIQYAIKHGQNDVHGGMSENMDFIVEKFNELAQGSSLSNEGEVKLAMILDMVSSEGLLSEFEQAYGQEVRARADRDPSQASNIYEVADFNLTRALQQGKKTLDNLRANGQVLVRATSGPVSIEQAKQNIIKMNKQFQGDSVKFWEFWQDELRKTGRTLVANPGNYRRVAKQAVKDVEQFFQANPQFQTYYNTDIEITESYLQQAYKDYKKGEDIAYFQVVAGLTSPDTNLSQNIEKDTLNVFNMYKRDGNLDKLKLRVTEKGNVGFSKDNEFTLVGKTNANKARSLKVFDKLVQKMGSARAAANYLIEGVSTNQLNEFNREMGYKGNVSKIGEKREIVYQATGQDSLIPRAFIFGSKIGAYVLNNLGESQYTTTDIWEARYFRSYFKDMMKETVGLPQTKRENEIFQKAATIWNEEFNKMTGLKLDPADAQAIRWFYTINALDQSGYKGAKTNETISEYTRRGLKTLLGIDIQSGGTYHATTQEFEGGQGSYSNQQARRIGPSHRARQFIKGSTNKISYRGQVSQDPRRSNTTPGKVDLTVEEFHQTAVRNQSNSEKGSSVTVPSKKDLEKSTLIVVKNDFGGTATAAVTESGELITVTRNPKATLEDVDTAIFAAIGTGRVKWSYEFDTERPYFLVPYGFKPVVKTPFNEDLKPANWDKTKYRQFKSGKPDLVYLVFDGEFNRSYANFKKIPQALTHEDALAAVDRSDITAEPFKTVDELVEAITTEFTPYAKKLRIDVLRSNTSSNGAAYIIHTAKGGGFYIEY